MAPVGRTVLVLAALAAGAVALALGVVAAVERARPGLTAPPAPYFAPARIPRLDVHQHLGPAAAPEAARLARAHGLGAVVNVSGGAPGDGLEASLAAAREQGGRLVVLQNVDLEGCCGPAWAAGAVAALERGEALGARGLSLPATIGAGRLALDAPELDPLFAACERLRHPVFLHGGGGPWEALERRLAAHRRLPFVAGSFAGRGDDPAAVSALLDRHPNLLVDTAAIARLGRAPEAARAAFLAHPDRILLGTDLQYLELAGDGTAVVFGAGPPGDRAAMLRFFDGTWRFLETRDRGIPSPVPADSDEDIAGVGLPREVLERVYRRNAERLLRVTVVEGRS